MNRERIVSRLFTTLVLGGVAAAVGFAVLATAEVPDGPVAVVWDKAACAHCSMHLGEPPFAAQLTTTSGATVFFDDPGCLFEFVAAQRPDVHRAFFRHLREDRWIAADAAFFVPVDQSPMGYRLGAVDHAEPSAIPIEAARERCLRQHGGGADRGAER